MTFVGFSQDKIAKVIQNLDPNKPYCHGNISIKMLKVCCPSVCKPLEMIFNQCIGAGVFPSGWKMSNIVLIHKEAGKK